MPHSSGFASGRFQSRFVSRFAPPSVLNRGLYGTPDQRREKPLPEKHSHKLAARFRRDRALTGKAGRPPLPETLEIFQKYYLENKPWKQCFAELWSMPGRKPPVRHERQRVMRRLRNRAKDYAKRNGYPPPTA
jgi:hypothetical protein